MRRGTRVAGTVLAAAGVLAAAWALTVWQWQDPFTALYTAHQQQGLEREFLREVETYVPARPARPTLASRKRAIRRAAARYRARLERGDAVGRLRIPRLGLDKIIVEGTDSRTLTKGPGRYSKSYVPGQGELVYIAGHRTTYGAPFARINRLRKGDRLTIDLPYARFVYRVSGHVIVPADDVARLVSRGREVIALQACHPRFFATHRYIVYAQPLSVTPRGAKKYSARGPA